ncbi:hypothetical protein C8R44DRAFT_775578 [Mycena epipterygia]|nr:hypothetical protein C8R44DRAFT_775578 [Mycena epipterygia]
MGEKCYRWAGYRSHIQRPQKNLPTSNRAHPKVTHHTAPARPCPVTAPLRGPRGPGPWAPSGCHRMWRAGGWRTCGAWCRR